MSAMSSDSAARAASRDRLRSTRAGEHMDKVRARMRRTPAAALLALPALLAFGRGGYFGVTRVRVAILACLLLALAAFVGRRPTRNAAISAGGLAALTVWTGCSVLWAPVKGPAFADLERLILYTAAF